MSALPDGRTAGLCDQSNASIGEAADWLASLDTPPSPIVPALRQRFGLTPREACAAIREAGPLRERRPQ